MNPPGSRMIYFSKKLFFCFIILFLSFWFKHQFTDTVFQLKKILFKDPAIKNERCFQTVGSTLQSHIDLPSENCKFCKDVEFVPKISNINQREFEKVYAYNGFPVVIQDAMKNWTAQTSFNFNFFKELYSESNLNANSCQFLPYNSGFNDMYDFLNMEKSRANLEEGSIPWYVGWNNCDENATKAMRSHYSRPYFLPETSESKTSDWVFMGSPGYGAKMHVDHVHLPSWQAQLRGSKLWTLLPPPECSTICKRLEVLVEPGETIVLDTNRWFHKTLIVGNEISTTIGAEYD